MVITRTKKALYFILGLIVIGCMIFTQRYDLVLVDGNSMEPTFSSSDLLLVDTRAYENREIQRGDILVARRSGELVVKRVVGLPNEQVEIKSGELFINGIPFPEPYRSQSGILNIGRGRLGDGRYAIVGDNRNLLVGVAYHAVIGKNDILGTAHRILSPKRWIP